MGMPVENDEQIFELAQAAAEESTTHEIVGGVYLHWQCATGVELWMQIDHENDLIGMAAHFNGKSRVRVGVAAHFQRPDESPLDGVLYCWVEPQEDFESGEYPIVFNSPDFLTLDDLDGVQEAVAQITAFASRLDVFADEAAYFASQADAQPQLAAESFIPVGLFPSDDDGEPPEHPESVAMISGRVLESATKRNSLTGKPYHHAWIATFGGTFDVVIDPEVGELPPVDGIVSGLFFVSGRLTRIISRKTEP
jgi:hypothetical protein